MENQPRGENGFSLQDTRTELVAAAMRLFRERGYQDVTLDDVAAAAGYTKGAFYWHFDSKESLLVEVFDAWTRQGVENLSAALRSADSAGRAEALNAWHAGDERRSRQWALFELELLRLAAQKPELAERLRERQRAVCGILARVVEEELEPQADSAPLDSTQVATLLAALSDGLLQHHLLDPDAVRGLYGKVVQLVLGLGRPA
jgi:AcrR family transcriptional regulator